MLKACLVLALLGLFLALPLKAFDWETATSNGREYVSLRSFCQFYTFDYKAPSGNDRFTSRNTAGHTVSMKIGSPDLYLDGVHYVMSFPVEGDDHDWLVSRMDVIKLFEPVLRPTEISGRHTIRGVVIDAGHGGSDNGATSRLGSEKNYTLDTAYRLDAILRGAGLKTVFTRRTDVFVDLYERAHIASLYPDYAFVSIHFNSASEEARGLETYCLSPRGAASTSSAYLTRGDIQKLPGNDYDTQNILLASMVHSEIIKLNPNDASADRGVKRARFVVIKQNVLPAILVEGGFVSNHMEAARVNQGDYRQRLAQAIARGVIRFVNSEGDRHMALPGTGLDAAPPAKPAPPTPPPAPAGLASDPLNKNRNAKPGSGAITSASAITNATTNPGAPSTTTSTHKKKSKEKKTAVAAAATNAAPVAPTPPPAPASTRDTSPTQTETPAPAPAADTRTANKMDLKEPATPTPTPGADKAGAEPDEPPTVNIYPTAPGSGSSTNAAPSSPPSSSKTPAEHEP
jgi:N-acetylmuramoyl-L-alanine amidase